VPLQGRYPKNRLIASAVGVTICVIISAVQVGACSNAGLKQYLHNCVQCGGGYIQINVCTSTVSGMCDEFHDQKLCGADCYMGEAGPCLSASPIGRKAKAGKDLLADVIAVNTLVVSSCSANETLENWVRSKHPERQQ
jgi:hypothetical protein